METILLNRTPRVYLFLAVFLLALVIFPLYVTNRYVLHLSFLVFLNITLAIAWNILGGYTGQISFGHSVFFGLGAYTTALLVNKGMSQYIALIPGGIIAAVYSILWGYPCLRLRGPYFAIATIGVSEATRVLMTGFEKLTGGSSGMTLPIPVDSTKVSSYFSALVIMGISFLISYRIKHSKIGLHMEATRENQDAAETSGVNTANSRLIALIISAFLVGITGGIYAEYIFYIEPAYVFGFNLSVSLILMTIIGGIGTLLGPVVGAILFLFLQEFALVKFPELHLGVYGMLLILIIMFQPDGIAGLVKRFNVKKGSTEGRSPNILAQFR